MAKKSLRVTTPVIGHAHLIVGVGASAGGLEAFGQLLSALPNPCGLSIVFVQHLDPQTESLMVELMSKVTSLKVVPLKSRAKLAPNTIYIAPPQGVVEMSAGAARVVDSDKRRPPAAIDHFLHSLADDQGARAVGVILSGAGSDGTLGLKAISDAGGLTFAQSPESAKYDSMPRNAAVTGVADHVMPPGEMAAELASYAKHMADVLSGPFKTKLSDRIEEAIPAIADRLLKWTEHDFRHYKINTLGRRIQRRMKVLKLTDVDDYLTLLDAGGDEPRLLFRELLIGVTAFFRDPTAFAALEELVIPKLFENRTPNDQVRIWVPGCAGGQEAYTIAMLCRERMDKLDQPPEVQVFATDIDERALQVARDGAYPVGIEEELSGERLKRFFVKRGKRYHVSKELREIVLFSSHNLISDPPFSRQDLISCRNLLIYLGSHLQKKLIPLFHYALRPSGYLMLGPSENISSHGELFRSVDAKHRISQRKSAAVDPANSVSLSESGRYTVRPAAPAGDDPSDLTGLMQRIVLDEFSPESVIVDQEGQIHCSSAGIDKYLSVAGGSFSNSILKMARSGLRLGLRAAMNQAIEARRRVVHENLSLRTGGKLQRVMITVQPMPSIGEDSALFMVVFHDIGLPLDQKDSSDPAHQVARDETDADAIILQLERELGTTRDDLDRSMQDMETANEELKSSNEELLSMNEELQSTNEELETSKEEIQAGVNALAATNNDLENLLRSTEIATIFLDEELRIRRFTPAATELYGLIRTDTGRPLSQLMPLADDMPPLPDRAAIGDAHPVEHVIHARSGRTFIRRVLPYRAGSGSQEGVVVTFMDITELHHTQEMLERSLAAARMDGFEVDLRQRTIHRKGALGLLLGLPETDALAEYLERVSPEDRHALADALRGCTPESPRYSFCYRLVGADGKYVWLRDEAEVFFDAAGQAVRLVGSSRDVTAEEEAQRGLVKSERQLRTIINTVPAKIAYVDADRRYRFANESLGGAFGFSADRVVGMTVRELLGEENYADIQPHLDAALRGEPQLYELGLRIPKTGEVRHKEVTYVPDVNPDGAVVGTYVLMLDITVRKKHEQSLIDREAHLRRVIDHMLGFVGVLEIDGTLIEANQTALDAVGVDREDVIGKKFWDCPWWNHDPAEAGRLKDSIDRARVGNVLRYDATIRVTGDARLAIEFMIVPVRNDKGEITHLIPSGIDIAARKEAEQEARQREQHLNLALRAGHLGSWKWDLSKDSVVFSDQLHELFGSDKKLFSGTYESFEKLVHPDDRGPLRQRIDLTLASDSSEYEAEFRVVRRSDQRVVWMHSRGLIRRGADGAPLSITGVAGDITGRKQGEIELADREAHLRRVINNQLGLVGVIDRDGNLLEVDDRSLAIAGLTREDVIGRHFADCPWWTYDPAVAAKVRESMEKAFAGEAVRYDVPLYAQGDARLMIDFMIAPVHDAEGNVTHLIPSGVDISDRKRAERKLKENERRLSMALKAGGMAAWEWNLHGSIWRDEVYELIGIPKDRKADPEVFFEYVHPEDVDELRRVWHESVGGHQSYEHEFRIVRPDGEVRWIIGMGEIVRNKAGDVVRIFGLNYDSTEKHATIDRLVASEQQAQQASVAKSEFLANMSHEIRTPMTAVLGYADLLVQQESDAEKRGHLETIKRNGSFLLDIINDILDLSKIEAGKLEISPQAFTPQQLVEDVESLMRIRAKEKQLDFSVHYDGPIPSEIKSDPKRLKQVLVNLIGNAIKFTESGGVRLTLRHLPGDESLRVGPRLEFAVSDTGIGISEADLSGLFKPFSQGDASVSKAYGGTGLGLTISRRLAKLLGGEITVTSQPGQGSTFTCTIAAGEAHGARMIEPSLSHAEESSGEVEAPRHRLACRVLVVDDRRDIRFLAERLLTSAGATVTMAEDGRRALEIISVGMSKGDLVDLILLDMQMPLLDGYQTARRLREMGYTRPIVALTANVMEGDRDHCLESGCDAYTSKPIDATELIGLVDRLTRKSSST